MSGTRAFQTTLAAGLDRSSFPMRLFQKSKRWGIWDPAAIDFSLDREHWLALRDEERDVLLRLATLFQAGEESVTLDLLPLIETIALEGRLEEEIYLTSFLWEEAKHVELFRRFLDEVVGDDARGDLGARYHSPSFQRIFAEELPAALGRLRYDRGAEAVAAAAVTYNMIVEGVLAESGYHAYHRTLVRHGILPGMSSAVALLARDESRHIAYGVFLLSRLLAEHGEVVWEAIESRMNRLLAPALGVVEEVFAAYDPMPFGLDVTEFTGFAMQQFERRYARLELARRQTLTQVTTAALEDDAADTFEMGGTR